jgi:hypothetical protein
LQGASKFPGDLLREQLEAKGIGVREGARSIGLTPGMFRKWLRAEVTPRGQRLHDALDALGLEKAQFVDFLVRPEILLVCPECDSTRTLPSSELSRAVASVVGRKAFRRRPDGRYERLCRECSARHSARRNFPSMKEMDRAELLALLGTPEERKRILKDAHKVSHQKGKTISPSVRAAMSLGRVASAKLGRDFSLCPLCGLVRYAQRWHRICWYTWMSYSTRTHGARLRKEFVPPALRKRGPSPERHLLRNYTWLIARRSAKVKRAALIGQDATRTTVTEAIKAFIRILPGSWDVVFWESKRRESIGRNRNRARQRLVPLPLELQPLVESGQRDGLIQRLNTYGMSEEHIALLVGATLYRVRGLVKREDHRSASG